MIEVCDICACEVALLHPVSLLQLTRLVGESHADTWRECYVCRCWVRRWHLSVT